MHTGTRIRGGRAMQKIRYPREHYTWEEELRRVSLWPQLVAVLP